MKKFEVGKKYKCRYSEYYELHIVKRTEKFITGFVVSKFDGKEISSFSKRVKVEFARFSNCEEIDFGGRGCSWDQFYASEEM